MHKSFCGRILGTVGEVGKVRSELRLNERAQGQTKALRFEE